MFPSFNANRVFHVMEKYKSWLLGALKMKIQNTVIYLLMSIATQPNGNKRFTTNLTTLIFLKSWCSWASKRDLLGFIPNPLYDAKRTFEFLAFLSSSSHSSGMKTSRHDGILALLIQNMIGDLSDIGDSRDRPSGAWSEDRRPRRGLFEGAAMGKGRERAATVGMSSLAAVWHAS